MSTRDFNLGSNGTRSVSGAHKAKPAISRRLALTLGLFGTLAWRVGSARAGYLPPRVTAGAIRWDAWEANVSDVNSAVEATLSPPKYQDRSPFCAKAAAYNAIDFTNCANQVSFDAEIKYASNAGLTYWAYCWYPTANPMMNGWKLHQNSGLRDRINWCMLWQFGWLGGGRGFQDDIHRFVGYFQQRNYQTVGDGRPLVYLYVDDDAPLKSGWSGNWENVRSAMDRLAAACSEVKLARPYLVVMQSAPKSAAEIMRAVSGDAISSYIGSIPNAAGQAAYSKLSRLTENGWEKMAATGAPIVPVCMTGWDTRPRKEHPPPWQKNKTSMLGMANYVKMGRPAEIGAHIKAALAYVLSHPQSCPADTIIIYSWNECDEGGSALVPSFSAQGADHSILDSVSRILKGSRSKG